MTEHRLDLGKVDYNGSGRRNCRAVLTWELKDGRFSMCAEIWNPSETDCYTCGQCIDEVAKYFPHNAKVRRMVAVWERWHLNDLKAGSPAQEAYLCAHPMDPESYRYPKSHYEVAKQYLAAAGLEPDGGYSYGSKWLREELPAEIVAEIASWAETVPA